LNRNIIIVHFLIAHYTYTTLNPNKVGKSFLLDRVVSNFFSESHHYLAASSRVSSTDSVTPQCQWLYLCVVDNPT